VTEVTYFGLPRGAKRIEFASGGVTLRGWLFSVPGPGPHPIVVMAHGWTVVKEMLLDLYAAEILAAGVSVLAYDHCALGESDGEPRQEIDPIAQLRGYRDAITYAQTLADVDMNAIGIWGTSYSGGHVLAVSAIDKRVKCVVAQCPTISGWQNTQARFDPEAWSRMVMSFEQDRRARFTGGTPAMTPIIPDISKIVLDPDRTHFGNNGAAWYANVAPSRHQAWRNEITLRSLELYAEYEPGAYIDRVSPTPLMMILADHDTVTPTEAARQAFARVDGPKELVLLPGGHYDLYGDQLAPAARKAAAWFVQHLLKHSAAEAQSGPDLDSAHPR
jgi:fermentation-respiration switch protein FrsA (DUF1100 family)